MIKIAFNPTTAILLGGMVIWGLEPGPRLLVEQKEFVCGQIASMRQSLLINHRSPMICFDRPIAGPIMALAIVLFLLPFYQLIRRPQNTPLK